jgi:hypothetical protein
MFANTSSRFLWQKEQLILLPAISKNDPRKISIAKLR